jgi:hypothetical protein
MPEACRATASAKAPWVHRSCKKKAACHEPGPGHCPATVRPTPPHSLLGRMTENKTSWYPGPQSRGFCFSKPKPKNPYSRADFPYHDHAKSVTQSSR